MAHGVDPPRFLAAAARLDRIQDRAVHLAIAEVHDSLVFEVLDEGVVEDERFGSVQDVRQPLALALDVADEPATDRVSDERNEHVASTGRIWLLRDGACQPGR